MGRARWCCTSTAPRGRASTTGVTGNLWWVFGFTDRPHLPRRRGRPHPALPVGNVHPAHHARHRGGLRHLGRVARRRVGGGRGERRRERRVRLAAARRRHLGTGGRFSQRDSPTPTRCGRCGAAARTTSGSSAPRARRCTGTAPRFTQSSAGTGEALFTVHANAHRFVAVGGFGTGKLAGERRHRLGNAEPLGCPGAHRRVAHRARAVSRSASTAPCTRARDGGLVRGRRPASPSRESLHSVWVDPSGGVWAAGGNVLTHSSSMDGVLVHRGPAVSEVRAVKRRTLHWCSSPSRCRPVGLRLRRRNSVTTQGTPAPGSGLPGAVRLQRRRARSADDEALLVDGHAVRGGRHAVVHRLEQPPRAHGGARRHREDAWWGGSIPSSPATAAADERTTGGAVGTEVQLNHPTDLAQLSDGTMLIMAWHNHKLRKIDDDRAGEHRGGRGCGLRRRRHAGDRARSSSSPRRSSSTRRTTSTSSTSRTSASGRSPRPASSPPSRATACRARPVTAARR